MSWRRSGDALRSFYARPMCGQGWPALKPVANHSEEVQMHPLRLSMVAIGALLTACNDPSPAPSSIASLHASTHSASARSASVSKEAREQIQQLRELTKPYRDFDAAVAAGWGTKITECFQDATLGGMGFHYGNTAYIDGAVDVL